METSTGLEKAGPSQPVGQGTFVGALNNSGDSGFREGNPGTIAEGEMWDIVNVPNTTKTTGGHGDGRVTRSMSSRVQADSNEIPGSGKNNPSGGHASSGGGDGTSGNQPGPSSGGGGGAPHAPGGNAGGGGTGGSGRNGNGGDPHPGRPVGAGGPGGSGPSASAGAAVLLAKLFSEPLKDPVPIGTQFLPCDTEEVKSEREGKGTQYSPVMWADPLIPVNITVGSTSSAIDRLPAVGVSVCNRLDAAEPQLTAQGSMLKAIIDTDASPTILRSMMPVRGLKDTSALICLLETARRTGIQALTDEAPLIRLGLLMHCLAPTQWMAYSTSCVQNLTVNG